MNKILVVAEMTVREIARRRTVLILLLLLPLAFYFSRRGDAYWQSVRFVCLGIGWALSTAALFAASGARGIEPRLRLAGYATRHLYLGRLVALWVAGLVLSAPYWLLIRLDLAQVRHGAVALILVLTVLISAPFGLAVSALLPRELEGMLVLLTVVAMQMMLNPEGTAALLLPYWFSREIGIYAIESDGAVSHVFTGLAHAGIVLTLLLAVVALASGLRLRRRRHLRFHPGTA
jgi:hypothetical protein